MLESSEFTQRFDEQGLILGDKISLQPINGRKKSVSLKRTTFYFISRHYESEMMSGCYALLPEMKNEKFKVKLSLVDTLSQSKTRKQRFFLCVEVGGAFKLNGSYHLGSYIERGDYLEIGFNRIQFKANDKNNEYSKSLWSEEQKSLVGSNLSILLQGETGVGKSNMAKKIHECSGRNGRFVQINLSAIAPNLIESELFGHVKGSFTGAHQDKVGVLKKADYGTLFLDEIDSLPKDIQTKLLLFLDDKSITPVGGGVPMNLDVRLIFASGRPLNEVVQNAEMRRDFYYRISNGITFKLDSLRNDPLKVLNFCQDFSLKNEVKITSRLVEFYQTLPWPGNYRQLKGHLESKLVMAGGKTLDFDKFDERLIEQSSELGELDSMDQRPTLSEIKNAYAKKVYYECDKNASQAAKVLDISSKCLRGMIKTSKSQLRTGG
ncbi:MAG: hypothetical protein CME65_14525 [Halobacteriovoraceae bacterium]|nr:hypothetical protein [Halobacteriovoraceae bacterium]|tara:strand:- start:352 stop:1656 length:1305 start_codon:yes stop_codon:yes gene_type:complete